MAIWMIRAGSQGEYEQKFLQENRMYAAWPRLRVNLDILPDSDGLHSVMSTAYPGSNPQKLISDVHQVWSFAHDIKKGDLVLMPLEMQPAITIGEVTGDYRFEHKGPDPFYHWRSVAWIAEAIPRSYFGRDMLYTFGSSMSLCRVDRNNAEERLAAMRANDWKPEACAISSVESRTDETLGSISLAAVSRDQIAQLIAARFQGKGLTLLVAAILKAKGYTTLCTPDAADGDVAILAAAGPLGFAAPRLCVGLHHEDAPVDRPVVVRLLEAVVKYGAQEALLVSWSGCTGTVQKELPASFFRLRLWSQKEVLDELFASYDGLDEQVKARLPLKQIWTSAAQDEP